MNKILVIFLLCFSSPQLFFAQDNFNVIPISDSLYVHQSYEDNQVRNGLLVSTEAGALIFDVPQNTKNLEKLLYWTEHVLKQPVVLVVISHFYPISEESQNMINNIGSVVGYNAGVKTIEQYKLNLMPLSSSYYTIFDCTFEIAFDNEEYQLIWLPEDQVVYIYDVLNPYSQGNNENILAQLKKNKDLLPTLRERYLDCQFIIPVDGQWVEFSEMTN